jgi:hypothetical protein
MEQYIAEGSKPVDRCKRAADALRDHRCLAIRVRTRPAQRTRRTDDRLLKSNSPKRRRAAKPVLAFLLDPEAPWLPNRADAMSGAHGAGEDVSRLRALLGTVQLF